MIIVWQIMYEIHDQSICQIMLGTMINKKNLAIYGQITVVLIELNIE